MAGSTNKALLKILKSKQTRNDQNKGAQYSLKPWQLKDTTD